MTPEAQCIAIAEANDWRRWKFGDAWPTGLKLADQRFNGYIRTVIKDAAADSDIVKLDIDEAWTQKASEVKANYIPLSHWVRGDDIRSTPPNYLSDLNAMHEAEKTLTEAQFYVYCGWLAKIQDALPATPFLNQKCVHATAAQRAEAFLRTLNLYTA